MGIKLLVAVYNRKLEARRVVAFMQSFVSMMDTAEYARRR